MFVAIHPTTCRGRGFLAHGVLKWTASITAVLIAGYGIYALAARRIHEYLFGMTKFAFIDLTEPIVLFFLDNLAIMGLFVFISHHTCHHVCRMAEGLGGV